MPALRTILCLAATALVAGCGSSAPPAARPPSLPRALASEWATQADTIAVAAAAGGDSCHAHDLAVSLQQDVAAAQSRISARLYAPLAAGVNTLVADLPCAHPKPPRGPEPPKHHGHGHGADQGNQGGEGG